LDQQNWEQQNLEGNIGLGLGNKVKDRVVVRDYRLVIGIELKLGLRLRFM